MTSILRTVGFSAAAATLASRTCARALAKCPKSLRAHLDRTNFRGEPVTLAEGVEVAGALSAGALVGFGVPSSGAAALVGAVGLADDIVEPMLMRNAETAPPKGLKGHLGALAHGQLTTGNIKILGIAVAANVLARECERVRGRGESDASFGGSALAVFDRGLDTVLIAASANLANLFDVRPSRALKATSIGVLIALCGPAREEASRSRKALAAAHAAATLLTAPRDFGARGMLGDAGANVLGANAGTLAALSSSRAFRAAAASVAVGLTLVSERVSFTRIISSSEFLSAIDEWGRS